MKMKKLLSFVALTLLATGCNNTTSNVSDSVKTDSATTATTTATEAPTTSETTSDSTTSETPVEKTLDLTALQAGFDAKITLTTTDEYGTTLDAYEVKVGDDVLVYDDYYSSNEKKQGWTDEAIAFKSRKQYEKHDFTEKGLLAVATTDLMGDVIYTEQDLIDPATGDNTETTFEEAFAVNAFQFLTKDDFLKQEDGTYALTITDDKKADDTFAKAYYGLNHQLYPVISSMYDGSKAQFKMNDVDITSFNLTVDENLIPTGFTLNFADKIVYGSASKNTLTGQFVKTGADSATKATKGENKYEELDEKLTGLRAGNFSFTSQFSLYKEDMWGSDSFTCAYLNGTYDGNVLNLTGYKTKKDYSSEETGKISNYYQITSADHYRAFKKSGSKYVYDGEEVDDSSAYVKMLPTFAFSSYSFNRVAASENDSGVNVYVFTKPLLYTGTANSNLFYAYKMSTTVANLTQALTVTTTKDTIKFDLLTEKNERSYSVTYFNIGTTAAFNGTIEEPAA